MEFTEQFETTVRQTIQKGNLSQGWQLVDAYPSTNMPYTAGIYRQINLLLQTEHNHKLFHTLANTSLPFSHESRMVFYLSDNYILNYIAKQFAAYFEEKGCRLFFFEKTNFKESSSKLFSFLEKGVDAAFFFNNVGLLQTFADGQNLWETLKIPCYDFLVDHPMYYADSLDHAPNNTTVICADKTHAEYVRRFYPKVFDTLFLPTGGVPSALIENNYMKWDLRPIDLLFIGSYKCNEGYPYDELDSFVMTYLQNHNNTPFEEAIEIYVKNQMGLYSIEDKALKEIIESHRYLETNLTALYRKQIMRILLDSGLCLEVYGNGWEQTDFINHPGFHLHNPVTFEEGIQLMGHAKIVLNQMAWFKKGSSERIFNAMAMGAVCVTDSSQYLDSFLQDGLNCCLYSIDQLEAIPDKIKQLLNSPIQAPDQMESETKAGAEIAANGQKLSMLHTWPIHLDELFNSYNI